ncbi:FAD-binding oxidoreductase [Aequorivita sp. H23M31]|uniref:FAD-binding oxidoreductase n=2 Tax=Aequorivita ciconiae TaxID=2494375 RepID=A0A410G780_9FLAO|nr:FAD-binding oxidoreductase [Aequorivita sp. H23M31]
MIGFQLLSPFGNAVWGNSKIPNARVRPGDANWPSPKKWERLKNSLKGELIKLESPFDVCKTTGDVEACKTLFQNLKNPYFLGDSPALTQTLGWFKAWETQPSVYAVAAQNSTDVAAAVNFARINNLRLVVKGGGHSYQGTSNAPDSLLIWTRKMNSITLHNLFVGKDCEGIQEPQHAVTIEAGAMWLQAYDAVTTKGGRYVQGGGCMTVGVAGLIQSGGFGSFSKNYGLAAAGLLEAEMVTANGEIEIVNAVRKPDLFWALKGGGGGTFGIVTKVTLRTRELPEKFGAVFGKISAGSNNSFKMLIEKVIQLYRNELFNPHWGETISFHSDNSMDFSLVFQGINKEEAELAWKDFRSWLNDNQDDFTIDRPLTIIDLPARSLWDVDFLNENAPGLIKMDEREGAPSKNAYWASNQQEAGQYLLAYQSIWIHKSLLEEEEQYKLRDALFEASRLWTTSLHFNKGLAGAKGEELEAAKNTAMNPVVLDSFALAIIAGEEEPSMEGLSGLEPDLQTATKGATKINAAMIALKKALTPTGSYLAESSYFEENWQQSYWGENYKKLSEIKKKYDPDGLFFVHNGVGSEEWSADGFTRKQ